MRDDTPFALKFTERELEVLECLCQGFSTKETSDSLFIAPSTVKTHVSSLLQKTQLRSRLALALWASRYLRGPHPIR